MRQPGSFSRCMMESDSESAARVKRLRRKSLAVSLAIEAAIVAALLLFPLLSPGVLPPLFIATPAPPYCGEPQPVRRAPPRVNTRRPSVVFTPVAHVPVLRHLDDNSESPPPTIGNGGNGVQAGGPQPGTPNGENSGAPILAPPPSATRTKPLPQSEGVMAARLIRRVQPDYPRIAEIMRLSGVVRLQAIIGTDGSVQRLEVLSGNPILAQAAVAAVRQWRYEPTRLNGQPVEVETGITVTFVLN